LLNVFQAVWRMWTAKPGAEASSDTVGAAPQTRAPIVQDAAARPPRPRADGLALRSAEALGRDVFADPQRVRWVLLQPEADAAARKFASLAGLGEKRAVEAREAREALLALLVADLPSEPSEHFELLLDVMQTGARDGMEEYVTGGLPRVAAVQAARPQPVATSAVGASFASGEEDRSSASAFVSDLPEAYVVEPQPRPQLDPEASDVAVQASASQGSMTPVEYELHVLPGTSARDVDISLVREYIQGSMRRRPLAALSEVADTDVLRDLRAIEGAVGRERLTVLGGLFFALQPERLVVQSKVRFVEFPGTEVASPSEKVAYRYTEEVTGTIPQLIARVERLHRERLAPGVLADGFRVEEVPSVPLFALREAIVNAVCHRDYSLVGANIQVRLFADRLEVQSPGGLPEPVTVDNILTESYARNPRVADMLRDLGYVERHGLGIDNMIQSMTEAHLPPPEFSNCATSFTVTLRFRSPDESDPESWIGDIGATALSHGQQKALVFARRMGRILGGDYQPMNLVDGDEAERELRSLVRGGWLVQNGTGSQAFYTLGPNAGIAATPEDAAATLPATVLEALPLSQRRILEIVLRHRKVKASEVLEISGLKDRRTVQRTLAALTERGLLTRRASSPTDPNATYEVNRDYAAHTPAAEL